MDINTETQQLNLKGNWHQQSPLNMRGVWLGKIWKFVPEEEPNKCADMVLDLLLLLLLLQAVGEYNYQNYIKLEISPQSL